MNLLYLKDRLILSLFVFGFFYGVKAQDIKLTGVIKDSLQVLPNSNVLAIPVSEDTKMTFGVSNQKGEYELKLQANSSYNLKISYLGYQPIEVSLKTSTQSIEKDFILTAIANKLDEVVLNYKIPLVVKEDTLIYSVESFTDGKERKLREVLKKLPGVAVDKSGNVTVRGKQVTKVLVEGKTFFTGDRKLAVNNIPADAVDQVYVLDNYSEIPMLKGLQDSNEMAMDIKLKEDKKKFMFGDIEMGGGVKDRYVVHPNLFYYSPKTNLNAIVDINNTGIKNFTFRDYINFEAGYANLMETRGSPSNLYSSEFARYLNNTDYNKNKNKFGALNIRHSFSNKTDMNAYVLVSDAYTRTQNLLVNEYTIDNQFEEIRDQSSAVENSFLLGKFTLDYEPGFKEDLQLNSTVKLANSNLHGVISTENPFQNNSIISRSDISEIDFNHEVGYTRKLSKDHTGMLQANINYNQSDPENNWLTNREILRGVLPLDEDSLYNIFQDKKIQKINFNAIVKDYWELNNSNHIYTTLGMNFEHNSFRLSEYQLLGSGERNDFSNSGFGNDLTHNFSDVFVGMEYKFRHGIYTFKPALFYHYHNWQTYQSTGINSQKGLLLPQFYFKADINNSEKLNFSYKLNAQLPSTSQLAANSTLSGFNSVFKGNPMLQNSLYHSYVLSYYKFSLYKNVLINAHVSYNKKERSLKNQSILSGIEQYSTLVMFNNPENNLNISGTIRKKINNLRYNLRLSHYYNEFYQLVNNLSFKNISNKTSLKGSVTTFFNDLWPEIEIGYSRDFTSYNANSQKSNFTTDDFFVELEYDFLKDFKLTADYSYVNYQNKSTETRNIFDLGNASLFYQKEDSPWGFEISVTNVFNVQYKQSNSFSDFMISDSRTFIMPRIIMLKVIFKL